jgi:glutathione S-transferase
VEGVKILARKLYELAGKNPELRFSPYCWRIRFALAHKDIEVETVPWHFTDTEALRFSGQARVPVLVDGDRTIHDSFAIASYLEEHYSDHPPLFPNGNLFGVRFINAWADSIVHPGISRLVVSDIVHILRPEDQAYFRESREKLFGRTLEEVTANRDQTVIDFRKLLQPVRIVLKSQPWLGGEQPDYSDYILAGSFMWARCVSRFEFLDPEDAVSEWFARVRGLFGGLGENAVRA